MNLRKLLFGVLICGIPLTGCCLLPAFQLVEEGEIIVERDFSLLSVKNVAGSITLQEWPRDYTLVKYRKEALTQADLQNIYPSVNSYNGKLSVSREEYNDYISNASISFDVYVPSGNYHAQLSSASGSIDVRQTEAGDSFDVHTVSGSVDIEGSHSLEVTTSSGSVDFICNETEEVRIVTTSGSVEGAVTSIGGSADVRVESVSGSVQLTCPAGAGGTFALRSVSGSIESAYPSYAGTGSAGSISLEVITVSGAIQIEHD